MSIAQKSLSILEDQMQHEFLACKKAAYYQSVFQDVQLQTLAGQLADCHKNRFERLFNFLSTNA